VLTTLTPKWHNENSPAVAVYILHQPRSASNTDHLCKLPEQNNEGGKNDLSGGTSPCEGSGLTLPLTVKLATVCARKGGALPNECRSKNDIVKGSTGSSSASEISSSTYFNGLASGLGGGDSGEPPVAVSALAAPEYSGIHASVITTASGSPLASLILAN